MMTWTLLPADRREMERLLATKAATPKQVKAWRKLFDDCEKARVQAILSTANLRWMVQIWTARREPCTIDVQALQENMRCLSEPLVEDGGWTWGRQRGLMANLGKIDIDPCETPVPAPLRTRDIEIANTLRRYPDQSHRNVLGKGVVPSREAKFLVGAMRYGGIPLKVVKD